MADSDYQESIRVLAAELDQLQAQLGELSGDDWYRPTLLVPFDDGANPWNVKSLVAHIDISIGLTGALLDSIQDGQPGRDRVSFFIADRREVAPAVYEYANSLAGNHTPASLLDKVRVTFAASIEGVRAQSSDAIGDGYFALMRVEEWIPSRVVEAVVHGLDVADAVGQSPAPTSAGLEMTAAILDELLTRRTVGGRPMDLIEDDLSWVRAASGRRTHTDPRLPLIG
jgi:uncharacterized protein (TIGR03083 family)